MNVLNKTLLIAAAAGGVLTLSAVNASADLACSGNICWHVHEHYTYPPRAHVIVHPNTWHYGPKIVIREHDGRGYWHGHSWVEW